MTFTVRAIEPLEREAARQLLVANGWAHRVQDAERFRMLLDNSTMVMVAVQDRQVIGFVRAMTDRLSNGYISMLVVHPQFRRKGVGRALVQTMLGDCAPQVTWILRAGREEAAAFFSAIGFTVSTEAMEFKRREA